MQLGYAGFSHSAPSTATQALGRALARNVPARRRFAMRCCRYLPRGSFAANCLGRIANHGDTSNAGQADGREFEPRLPRPPVVHGAGGSLLQHRKELQLHTNLTSTDSLLFFTTCGWMMWNWQLSALSLGTKICLYDGNPGYSDLTSI